MRERCFVDSDHEHPVGLVRGRREDLRYLGREESIGRDEPAGLAVDARRIVSVVAEVRRDVEEIGSCRHRLQITREPIQVDHARRARRLVDDRVEVDEGIVACRVHVALPCHQRRVVLTDDRMATRRAHVLLVRAPRLARRGELITDRLQRRRIHATLPERLSVRARALRGELDVLDAVGLGRRVGRLPADLRDVVVEARVPYPEVLREQFPLLDERAVEVVRG